MTRPRRRLVVLLVTGGLLLVGWLVGWSLTRAPVVASVIAGRVAALLGGEAAYESARWSDRGQLEITGFTLRVPDLDGLAGEVARVDRLLLDISWSGLVGGDVVYGVAVDGATLRVAEDLADPWQYNLGGLSPEAGGGGGDNRPNILVSGLRLEVGTYDSRIEDSWLLMGRSNFAGEAVDDPAASAYVFRLAELMVDPPREPLELQGRLGHEGNAVEIMVTGVQLDERFKSLMPAVTVRRLWEEFQLQGQVEAITGSFGTTEPARIVLAVADIDLVLPQSPTMEEVWARYRGGTLTPITESPLLHVDQGEIIFTGTTLKLEQLNGYIVAESQLSEMARVPYVINMEISDLPLLSTIAADADLDSMLSAATAELQLETRGFLFEQGGTADLPRQAAEIFALFGVESCVVDIKMAFRLEPEQDDLLSYTGRLSIRDASGAFQGFPYPLRDLNADITFNESEILLEDLVSRGSARSIVSMRGTVSNEAQPRVDIRLTATSLPLDLALVEAMPAEANSMMKSLFGRHGVTATAIPGRRSPTHEEVGVDLTVRRAAGRDQKTTLSGEITFDQLNLTWEGFPYPITLGRGRLDWHGDTMDIESIDGTGPVPLFTDGGGQGVVRGVITLPSEDQAAAGQLDLAVRDDDVNTALIEALATISPGESDLLRELGLSGTVNYTGELVVSREGQPDYDLVIQMVEGRAAPTDPLAQRLGLPGPLWPEGLVLDEVQANLIVRPGNVLIESMYGRNAETVFSVEGAVRDVAEDPLELTVALEGLPLTNRIFAVLPAESRSRLTAIWEAWRARGRISLDAEVTGVDEVSGIITAIRLEAENGEVARLSEGLIEFDPAEVRFRDLVIGFSPEAAVDGEDWSMVVDGTLDRGEAPAERMTITTRDGRFGSVFLREVVADLMESGVAATWRTLDTEGRFDGQLEVDSGTAAGWTLDLIPRRVSVTHGGERLRADFSRGEVFFSGEGIARGTIAGEANIGAFDLAAEAEFGEGVSMVLGFDFEGRLGSPEARAILPDAIAATLGDLQWEDGRDTRLQNGRLEVDVGADGAWSRVDLEATVELREAAMDFGVVIDQVKATGTGRYQAGPSGPATLAATFTAESLRAAGRDVSAMTGTMSLGPEGRTLIFATDAASIAEGGMTVSAEIAVDAEGASAARTEDDWSATLLVANADLVQLFGGDSVEQPVDEVDASGDPVEGRVHMSLFVGGCSDEPLSRRGVGGIRITEAMLGDVPVIVGIQQMLHLTVPTLSRPDFVDIQYLIDGDQIVLRDILIESSLGEISVFSMRGEGTFDARTGEIDAVLFPRGGLLIVDDLIGMVQDQLYAVRISGPLEDPDVGLVPFPGLR